MMDRGFDITGTDETDILNGTNVVDRITGLAGQDVLDSGDGEERSPVESAMTPS